MLATEPSVSIFGEPLTTTQLAKLAAEAGHKVQRDIAAQLDKGWSWLISVLILLMHPIQWIFCLLDPLEASAQEAAEASLAGEEVSNSPASWPAESSLSVEWTVLRFLYYIYTFLNVFVLVTVQIWIHGLARWAICFCNCKCANKQPLPLLHSMAHASKGLAIENAEDWTPSSAPWKPCSLLCSKL